MEIYHLARIVGYCAIPIIAWLIATKIIWPIIDVSYQSGRTPKIADLSKLSPLSVSEVVVSAICIAAVVLPYLLQKPASINSVEFPLIHGLVPGEWVDLARVVAIAATGMIVIFKVRNPLMEATNRSLSENKEEVEKHMSEIESPTGKILVGVLLGTNKKAFGLLMALMVGVFGVLIFIEISEYPEGWSDCIGFPLEDAKLRAEACTLVIEDSRTLPVPKAGAYYERGKYRLRNGRITDAIADWQNAADLDIKFTLVHNDLAWMLATHVDKNIRNGELAFKHAKVAAEVDGNPNYRDTLAAALAELGRYTEAAEESRKAIKVAREFDHHELADKFEARSVLYNQGLPLRCPGGPCN